MRLYFDFDQRNFDRNFFLCSVLLRNYFLSDFEEGSVSDLRILRNLRTHKLCAQSDLENCATLLTWKSASLN